MLSFILSIHLYSFFPLNLAPLSFFLNLSLLSFSPQSICLVSSFNMCYSDSPPIHLCILLSFSIKSLLVNFLLLIHTCLHLSFSHQSLLAQLVNSLNQSLSCFSSLSILAQMLLFFSSTCILPLFLFLTHPCWETEIEKKRWIERRNYAKTDFEEKIS